MTSVELRRAQNGITEALANIDHTRSIVQDAEKPSDNKDLMVEALNTATESLQSVQVDLTGTPAVAPAKKRK